jgi:recombination protein RecA
MSEQKMSDFLRDSLNDTLGTKGGGVAFKLDESTPSTVKGYISTGSCLLDIAISNVKNGGIPQGRLTEIAGMESIGKSLLGYHLMANCQKLGGTCILIDTENAASIDIMKNVGIKTDDLIYMQLETTEKVFDAMEHVIHKVRAKQKNIDTPLLIVWDSVAATSTEAEFGKDVGEHTIALQARIISKGLRKLTPFLGKYNVTLAFINQLRTRIGITFGDDKITPGGKAIPFYSSVRLRLVKEGDLKTPAKKEVYGVAIKTTVKKNKVAPPFRRATFKLRFGKGIQDVESWFDPLVELKVIEQTGAWYSHESLNGGTKFRSGQFMELVEKDQAHDIFKGILEDHFILKIDMDDPKDIDE